MRFVFVRHGESTYNAEGRIQGQQDAPLSERGRAQATRVAERLRGAVFDACYASDLSRAADTARVIMQFHPAIPYETTPLLREIGFGVFEGLMVGEIENMYPDEYAEWNQDRREYTPPGAESVRDLHTRAVQAFAWLRERGHSGSVLVVSHGGLMRSMVAHALGFALEDRLRFHFDNTSISVILEEPWGSSLRLCNDTSHLGTDLAAAETPVG